MAKKQSESSQPVKLIRRSAESILAKPLTKRQKSVLDRIAARQAGGDDSHIDYSDIPALSKKQLAEFQRTPKKLVAVRLDASTCRHVTTTTIGTGEQTFPLPAGRGHEASCPESVDGFPTSFSAYP